MNKVITSFTKKESTRAKVTRLVLAATLAITPVSALFAQTLTVMQSEAPRSMDPGDQSATFTSDLLDPLYEGLLKRLPGNQIAPALATSWTSDESGLVWEFSLREGIKFHDGTDFNADVVVYNFNRHLDSSRGLAASGRIRQVIDKVEALDDNTVRFTLKTRYPAFLAMLTLASSWMVSPAADEAGTIGSRAVGTGRYRFVEYKSGEYVLEEKNPDYWDEVEDNTVEQIKWTWTAESSVMNMAVQTGDADIVNPLPPIFASQLANVDGLDVVSSDGSSVFWLAINTKLSPLDDVRVRQALNYATDRDGLVRAIMSGFASPANSPLPPVMGSYDASLAPYDFNLEKAKQLLADAGYAQGFAMSVAVQETEARIAEVLQAMWKQIGVDLDVRRMESGIWTQAAFADVEGKRKDNIGSVIASWSTSLNDADLQLRPLYHSVSVAPAGANLGFFEDKTLDDLLDKALLERDETKRNQIYVQAQQHINEQAPHVLLYTTKDIYAKRNTVTGVIMEPGGGLIVKHAVKN